MLYLVKTRCDDEADASKKKATADCDNPVCSSKMDLFRRAAKSYGDARQSPLPPTTMPPVSDDDDDECPLDREQLGRSAWNVLHTVAAYYPDTPTAAEQEAAAQLIRGLATLYPCEICAPDFRDSVAARPPECVPLLFSLPHQPLSFICVCLYVILSLFELSNVLRYVQLRCSTGSRPAQPSPAGSVACTTRSTRSWARRRGRATWRRWTSAGGWGRRGAAGATARPDTRRVLLLASAAALFAAPVGARALGGGVRLRLGVAADAHAITAFYGLHLGLAEPYTLAHVARAIAEFPTLVIVAEAGGDDTMVGCAMGRYDQLRCFAPPDACSLDGTGDGGAAAGEGQVEVPGEGQVQVPCAVDAFAGHVLSIAVAGPYLRLGVGSGLLGALHAQVRGGPAWRTVRRPPLLMTPCLLPPPLSRAQLKDEHDISRVSLHVRTANVAAIAFYSGYDYQRRELLRDFYEAGGDAWLMVVQRELFAARAP